MGYATGRQKSTVTSATQATATQPTARPYLPRLNGPGTKDFRAVVTRKKMGSAYAMYSPVVATDTIAWNATWLPSDCQIKLKIRHGLSFNLFRAKFDRN